METSQQHKKEKPRALIETGNKYGKILRDRVEKLKQWGVTGDEAKEIYKTAILSLHALGEEASPSDKAAAIEASIIKVLGKTKYDTVTAQARVGHEIRFRIEDTLK